MGQHLISVDELRAAGALDVPPAWRKSLGAEERDLFSDLPDDDQQPDETASTRVDSGHGVRPAAQKQNVRNR